MFDATTWPTPQPRRPHPRQRPRRRALITASTLLTLLVSGAVVSLADPPLIIINAPSHLRQIEIAQNPFRGELKIYLANAGFRDIHKHLLLATITGANRWQVIWQADNAATILLRPATASVTQYAVPGIRLKFTT
jgi:hypothetical protein